MGVIVLSARLCVQAHVRVCLLCFAKQLEVTLGVHAWTVPEHV